MIRKPYFSLFLLCLPLFSLCSSGNDDPAPAPAPGKEWLDPIRVATYNIQYDNSSDQDNKWTTRRDLLRQLLQSEKFDIVFLDPPYASGLLQQALTDIAAFDICRAHGIIIAESAVDTVLPEMPAPYALYREYKYGKIKLTVYHRGGNEDTE